MYYANYLDKELAEFQTEPERDEWVERLNSYHDKPQWKAVSTSEAAALFDLSKFDDGDYCREYNKNSGLATCTGKSVFYIDNVIEKRTEVIQARQDALRVVDEISRELRQLSRRIDKYVADLDEAWDFADEFDFDKGIEDARNIIRRAEGDMQIHADGIRRYRADFIKSLDKVNALPTLDDLAC